jgi:hypothetical protein
MKYKLTTTLLVVAALVVATFSAATTTPPALAAKPTTTTSPPPAASTFYVDGCPPSSEATKPPCDGDSVILRWDEELLSLIREYPKDTGPTITARALGVLHTATYDAWAAYDPTAKVTRPDGPAPQTTGNTLTNKEVAISYAAYRVLIDLFPPGAFPPKGGYKDPDVFLREVLGYPANQPIDATVASPDATAATPAGVGNLAAKAVLDYRRGKLPRDTSAPNPYGDGSNQLGDDPNGTSGGRYSDTTGYTPANTWNMVNNRWRWQPLCVLTALGVQEGSPPVRDPNATSCPDSTVPSESHYALQKALTPQWGKVVAFGQAGSKYKVTGPPRNLDGSCCSTTDIVTAVKDTSNLSDSSKTRAEYWADGPGSVFPPGHTAVFAQALSRKKGYSLDTDVKLFFLVGNAMMDASIAAWYQKFLGGWPTITPFTKYDYVRPITAVREYYKTQNPPTVPGAWLGPNHGFGDVPADKWLPYQALTVVTPGFPEYVSGHSTFTSAGATMLASFNGGDTFGAGVIIKAGSSQIEKGGLVPAADVPLTWPTFSDAANDAGMSRRWGGIHFYTGDVHGRALGRQVATTVWGTGQNYIKGYTGK